MSKQKNTNLVEVDFLVCCNHKKSKQRKSCINTVNAIRKNFNNINTISAIRPIGNSEDMCVMGTAIINPSKKKKFEKDLEDLKVDSSSRQLEIKKVIIDLPK